MIYYRGDYTFTSQDGKANNVLIVQKIQDALYDQTIIEAESICKQQAKAINNNTLPADGNFTVTLLTLVQFNALVQEAQYQDLEIIPEVDENAGTGV